MKLYYFETPNGFKACSVAKHLGSPVEYVKVNLAAGEQKQPDFLAINPNGRIPALVDGDTKVWESAAIMVYLSQKAGSDLWPSGVEQVEVMRWVAWDAVHFSRHGATLFFENIIKPNFGLGEANAAAVQEATSFWRQFAGVLDAHLKGQDFVANNRLSIADFSLACMLPMAEPAQIPLGEYPEVQRWFNGMMSLPAVASPYPE